ncbi:MAG: fused MFS/spermidine synthase, partial [Thermoguttaceae bacterium]
PARLAVAMAVLLLIGLVCADHEKPLFRARSFFGVLRVEADRETDEDGQSYVADHRLLHGSTEHGRQSCDPEEALQPWTYYHRTGPVGDLFEMLETRPAFRKRGRIGVVGLGTGTLAAYGQPGQRLTFFEIDPAVDEIAHNPRFFTYLRDCRADLDVRLGDARLSLEREEELFDVLLIDAFSSDAIPVHLLTREALEIYFSKLARRGLLAVHISNRHLLLKPVLGNLAEALGVAARVCDDDDESYLGKCRSTWVVLTLHARDLGDLNENSGWKRIKTDSKKGLWTDDFSNIVSVIDWDLKWRWLPGWEWWHRHVKRPAQEEGPANE